MGCSTCGQKGLTGRGGRKRVAHVGASGGVPAGFGESNPIVIGEAGGPVLRVRVAIPVESLSVNASVWVTGTGVQAHVASGALVDITSTAQRRRLWRVGGFTYTDYQEASRVAASLGTTPVEVA